jgi:hypothetical protein
MTKLEIITRAQLWLDDTSELSTQEFSDAFDTNYRKITRAHVWEGTKKEGTGTTSTSVATVALPSDFLFLTANHNYTDSSNESGRPVIFRGTTFEPYKVVSWSDRRQYRNNEGYAYIDWANSTLVFTNQPSAAEAVEFDYHAQATALTDNVEPWFPAEFHDQLFHMIVADDFAIQASDKAKSYRKENMQLAQDSLDEMKMWNSNLVQI